MSQSQEFLQSDEWLQFQKAAGKQTMPFSQDGFLANGIIHHLSFVGEYLYIPRGPVFENTKYQIPNTKFTTEIQKLIEQAKEKKMRWIRIEPETEEMLEVIKKVVPYKIVKAPHDMQPKEIFVIDITKDQSVLLAEMKSKTRYNIGLAEKRGVKVFATREERYKQAFLDLIVGTSLRKKITPHPRAYYENFFLIFPEERCQLFVAEYEGKVLAANLLLFFGTRATYLHGGSGDEHRGVMAPYLLQWKQIQYAKEKGCTEYDFGGVKTTNYPLRPNSSEASQLPTANSSWGGITKFKIGFSPNTKPVISPGSYDMILDSVSYSLYKLSSWLRGVVVKIV